MDISLKTKKPMTKDEVSLLLDLMQCRPIIISKETNASSNKMKEEAWTWVTNEYNSRNGLIPRHKDQLKAKWDNLKKAAQKRCQQIRLNNLKTGGGKPDFIPPDEILERVAGQLGSTCTGFEVPFGGDGVVNSEEVVLFDGVAITDGVSSPVQEPATADVLFELNTPEPKYISLPISEAKKRKIDEIKPRCLYGMKNMTKELQTSKGKKKKYEDDGRRERNLSISKYYDAKTRKLNLEIEELLAKKTSQVQASTSDTSQNTSGCSTNFIE